jgi:hypothetical protein
MDIYTLNYNNSINMDSNTLGQSIIYNLGGDNGYI